MIRMQGIGISAGYAEGPLFRYSHMNMEAGSESVCSVVREIERFLLAQKETQAELFSLAETAGNRVNDGRTQNDSAEEAALLFEGHAMIAADEELTDCVLSTLRERGCSAEEAVRTAGERFAVQFESMEDAYLKARAADVRDVMRRLIRRLSGREEERIELAFPAILAADDLLPSELIRLDREMLLGIILEGGSENSHAVILARIMGIPTVIRAGKLTCGKGERDSCTEDGPGVLLDGVTGAIVIDPDEEAVRMFRRSAQEDSERYLELEAVRGLADVTPDGITVEVSCSIGGPEDLDSVFQNDGRSIGLFRSEFLALSAGYIPGEEEQFDAYRRVVCAMNGARTVIRVFDIGADKQVEEGEFAGTGKNKEAKASSGIGYLLSRPELFCAQLRAIYRASAFGKTAILFPMIRSMEEVEACIRFCLEARMALDEEGIAYDPKTEIGVMIETEEAVMIADEIAGAVDYCSIGTNDLAHALCPSRDGSTGRGGSDPWDPRLIRALKRAADAAHRHGIRIEVCGELAADCGMLPLFLAIGIDELAVTPSGVLPLRHAIRSLPSACPISSFPALSDPFDSEEK